MNYVIIKDLIYTPLSWDSSSGRKDDMETFIFNLNKNKKYKKLNMVILFIVIIQMDLMLLIWDVVG